MCVFRGFCGILGNFMCFLEDFMHLYAILCILGIIYVFRELYAFLWDFVHRGFCAFLGHFLHFSGLALYAFLCDFVHLLGICAFYGIIIYAFREFCAF